MPSTVSGLVLHLGDDPLSNIFSFFDLHELPNLSSTCRYFNAICEREWARRDSLLCEETKSKATTPRERLGRLCRGRRALDKASSAFLSSQPSCPQHLFLKPTPQSEPMLRLYSLSKQVQIWEGFLGWKEATDRSYTTTGWQLDVSRLARCWSHLMDSLPISADTVSLEELSQLVDDLLVILVVLEDGTTRTDSHSHSHSHSLTPHAGTGANLVICTQGVALSQRQHNSAFIDTTQQQRQQQQHSPLTFVLRQQVLENTDFVVHLSLHAHANVLDEISVCYFYVPQPPR